MSEPHTVMVRQKQDVKREILIVLAQLEIIAPGDTGQIVVHINNGGITKVVKNVEVK